MKSLVEVKLRDVTNEGMYLVHVIEYERFGDRETYLRKGSGSEVITFIKDHVGFEEEDNVDLFDWFEEDNGDGDDYFSIFEL